MVSFYDRPLRSRCAIGRSVAQLRCNVDPEGAPVEQGLFGMRLYCWAILLPVVAVAACVIGELRAGVSDGSPTGPPAVLG